MLIYEHPDGYTIEVDVAGDGYFIIATLGDSAVHVPIGRIGLLDLIQSLQALVGEP